MRRLAALVALAAALALPAAAHALDAAPPPFDARAALVANGSTGEILYQKNPDRRLPIASITKLMTVLVALERAGPAEIVTVPAVASSVGESSIYLTAGEQIRVRDLIAAALIQSANDAAWALAAHGGTGDVRAFIRSMNRKARALGLDDTRFARPDGLDTPGNYSSARDVLALARAAMRKPLVRQLVRMRSTRIAGGRSLFTWNDLLSSFPGLIGVKTGHTLAAGWCQVAAVRRDGVTIYAVILGSPTREQRNEDLAELLEWGVSQYARLPLVRAGRTYGRAAVPFSEADLTLVAPATERAVVRLGRPLVQRVTVPAMVDLPVARGQRLGEVEVFDGSRLVARSPLVASEAVAEPSVGDRVGWYAGRALTNAGEMLESVLPAS